MASVHHCDLHLHFVSFQQLLVSNKSHNIRCNFVYVSRKQRILNHSEMEKTVSLSVKRVHIRLGPSHLMLFVWFIFFIEKMNIGALVLNSCFSSGNGKYLIIIKTKFLFCLLFSAFSCDADLHSFCSFLKNHCQRKCFTTNSRFKQKKGRKSKFGIYKRSTTYVSYLISPSVHAVFGMRSTWIIN